MLDSFSIATSIHRDPLVVDTSQQILDSSSTNNTHVLILDTSQSIKILRVSINRIHAISVLFLPDLSRQKSISPSPKHPKLNLFIFLTFFSVLRSLFFIWYDAFSLFIMHFMIFDLTFGVVENLFGVFQN